MDINEEELMAQIRASLQEQATAEGIELSEEELTELSKKTLGSYIKAATNDLGFHMHSAGSQAMRQISSTKGSREHEMAKANSKDAHAKASKRKRGIEKATDKLVKESIEDMLQAAVDGKPVEFGAAFNNAIGAVVAEKIDAMRPEVAASLFGDKE